ncbi:beta-1,4-endoglucanase [Aphelenchoides avenae]|nr:beta-1,4-endoglucanase [Aphelenchus avenae]
MTRAIILIALVVLGANALTPKDPPYGQLSVKGTKLVGKDGNPVQLIGMSLFWSQWMGQYFNRDTVNALACQWGSNVVRAAMGVSEGGTGYLHDKNELQKVRTVVEAAIERGIYVIIDWHDHNAHQHKADAIAFFQQMATDYGKYPHVLYETFNEPLQISWQNDLKPYHTDVVNAIRKIDAKNVALLGTPAWSGESGIIDASNSPLTGMFWVKDSSVWDRILVTS